MKNRVLLLPLLVAGVTAAVDAGGPIPPQPKMGDPLLGLTTEQLQRFLEGQVDYNHTLSVGEGLGPVFNKESCGNCHNNPTGGTGSQTVTRFGAVDKGSFDPLDMLGGSLLQSQSISLECAEVIPPEANITAFRVTNGMMGYGLVEAIPDAQILANESGGPGVSGRAHMTEAFEAPGVPRVGRFGWKAQVPTMLTFSADAAQNELGLTNRFLPTENDPNGINPPELADCDQVPDPEDGPDADGLHFIDRVTNFQRYLAAPPQTPRSGMIGESVFVNIGCAQCHVPSFTTSNDPPLEEAIRGKTIRPYSDFLLHDMGAAADFIPAGDAAGEELKTPTLWGLRVRDPMWHDGRFAAGTFAERVTLAIQEHGAFGSEGIPAASAFNALPAADREALIRFLDSLGRREFDADGDDAILMDDFLSFRACMGAGVLPDDPCAVHDIDQNGTVDASDFASFLLAWEGPQDDCNDNGVIDIADIVNGTSQDADADGVPDECACSADLNGSGDVGFDDLLGLLAAWGPCGGCPADFDSSGDVGFADLLTLLAAWGPCP